MMRGILIGLVIVAMGVLAVFAAMNPSAREEKASAVIPAAVETAEQSVVSIDPEKYPKPDAAVLKEKLTPLQYEVTQQNGTEPAFSNEFWDNHGAGLYVDVVTGEPLFTSTDKYESGTGWPSFTKPISPEVVTYVEDTAYGMIRVEVRSRSGDSHLGHVFDDGPADRGGKRFCMNSAAMGFVPLADMEAKGYGYLTHLIVR